MKPFDKIKMKEYEESIKNRIGSDSSAGNFFKSVKNRMGIGSPERNATDTYERGMAIVPECISANENEIPVKQYNIAILRNMLKFERAEGRMQITNKRVIFRAAGRSVGGRTTVQHEYAIDEVAGIEARNNYKFSFMYLIFAMLIIVSAFYIIYRPSFSGIMSPLNSQSERISKIISPNRLVKAYQHAHSNVSATAAVVKNAYEAEERAGINVRNGIQRTRRVQTGTDWWGTPQYGNETFRDRSQASLQEAQLLLDAAIDEREKAVLAEQAAIAELRVANKNIERWKFLMSIFGLVLGIGGLIPFFALYKKFGIKLFILNFSIFGFALSLAASGFRIFNLLLILSVITTIVCIFLFCFRPNLVISIKNKTGSGDGPIDIRRNTIFTKHNERGTGFAEIIPTGETEGAIREIGAIVGDIQKLGDLGLEKWSKK